MTRTEFAEKLRRNRAWLPGRRVKLDFGEEGVVTIDGVAGEVSEEPDVPAETRICTSWADWLALSEGRIDPVSAYMSGRIRVEGDFSAATELGALFRELKG